MEYRVNMKNIIKRGNKFSVRIVVPPELRGRIGKREIVKALGTSSALEAEAFAKPILKHWTDTFESMRSSAELVQVVDVDQAVKKLNDKLLVRLRENMPSLMDQSDAALVELDGQYDFFTDNVRLRGYVGWDEVALPEGLSVGEGNETVGSLIEDCGASQRARRRVLDTLMRICWSVRLTIRDELGCVNSMGLQSLRPIPKTQSMDLGPHASTRVERFLTISDVCTECLKINTSRTAKGRDAVIQHIALLIEAMGVDGGGDIAAVTKKKAVWFRDEIMRKYPKNANKLVGLKGLNLKQLLATDSKKFARITTRTVNNRLTSIASVFQYAKDEGYIDRNPFGGRGIKLELEVRPEDINRSVPPGMVIEMTEHLRQCEDSLKPMERWIPIILAYSGLRLNEASQLRVGDVRKVDDIWVFDVNDRDKAVMQKRLKNPQSRRMVPIHQKLLDDGIVDALEIDSRGPEEMVWGEGQVTYTDKSKWTRKPSRWINIKLIPVIIAEYEGEVDEKLLNAHSLRHSFISQGLRCGISDRASAELTGHSLESVGVSKVHSGYQNGSGVDNLKREIDKLKYDL